MMALTPDPPTIDWAYTHVLPHMLPAHTNYIVFILNILFLKKNLLSLPKKTNDLVLETTALT